MSHALHAHTPMLSVVDCRSLPVRLIACHRLATTDTPNLRVTRHFYDPASRLIASQDPRLPIHNQRSVHSLSSQVLLTDSVDAGWRVTLPGEAGQLLSGWDGRGTQRQVEYNELLRPVLIRETNTNSVGATGVALQQGPAVERFTYGGPELAEHNQCNQLARHDDTAGTIHHPDYSVLGSPLSEVRHFLRDLDMPDWPLEVAERDALLETDDLESSWAFNALGEEIRQTDAMSNSRHFTHTVAGQLKSVALGEQVLIHNISYNAFGQVEQQTAGNRVISRSTYDPQSGRLIELGAALPNAPPLQLLKYSYDPVGNIEQIEDAAQPVHFFANQRIEPINQYHYDTLYQLIEATGREVKTGASHGPALPDLQNLPPDPNQIANYTQSYEYDAGGNLLEMHHVGAQPFNRLMHVAPDSNRSLPIGEVDVEIEDGFDANGNLQQLVRGQDLSWDARNQLRQITTVQRDGGPSDNETYIYDGQGQRCRKISSAQASGRTLINEVRYLPGLEVRSNADGETLQVITVNNVRLLHWPAGTHSDQLRYSLSDHLGSSTLELDHQGGLISQESYYPFGGTSWWAARSAVEAKYKTVRYSGKERDASGLYYYGFRYYAPWLQRWINPDPAGDVEGLNIFEFTVNQPISKKDQTGLNSTPHSADQLRELRTLEKDKLEHALQLIKSETTTLREHIQGFNINISHEKNNTLAPLQISSIRKALSLVAASRSSASIDIDFYLSNNDQSRTQSFSIYDSSGSAKPAIIISSKIFQQNKQQGNNRAITGGIGRKGLRGVADQAYDEKFLWKKKETRATAVVVHELGHIFHELESPESFWGMKKMDFTPPDKNWLNSAMEVSHYATNNSLEFIAEAYTGMVLGKKYNHTVRQSYELFGGPHYRPRALEQRTSRIRKYFH